MPPFSRRIRGTDSKIAKKSRGASKMTSEARKSKTLVRHPRVVQDLGTISRVQFVAFWWNHTSAFLALWAKENSPAIDRWNWPPSSALRVPLGTTEFSADIRRPTRRQLCRPMRGLSDSLGIAIQR
jgi:hypothetical protein